MPGAELEYIVQSHHHVDHAGGVRDAVALTGATLVCGEGVAEFYHDSVFSAISSLALILNVAALILIFRKQKKQSFSPSEVLLVCQLVFDGGAGFSNILWMLLMNFAYPAQFIGPGFLVLCKAVFSNLVHQV